MMTTTVTQTLPDEINVKSHPMPPEDGAWYWGVETLTVTDVRVQRLQDISKADAIAEGLTGLTKDGRLVKYGIPDRDGLPGSDDLGWHWHCWDADPRRAYTTLWDRINGAGAWDANPFVAAYSFTVALGNIDEVTP